MFSISHSVVLTANGLKTKGLAPEPCTRVEGRSPTDWLPPRPTNNPTLSDDGTKRSSTVAKYVQSLLNGVTYEYLCRGISQTGDLGGYYRYWPKFLGSKFFSGLHLILSSTTWGDNITLKMEKANNNDGSDDRTVGPLLKFNDFENWGDFRRAIWDYFAMEVLPRIPEDCLAPSRNSATARATKAAKVSAKQSEAGFQLRGRPADWFKGGDYTPPRSPDDVVDVTDFHTKVTTSGGAGGIGIQFSSALQRMQGVVGAINLGVTPICRAVIPGGKGKATRITFNFIDGPYKGISVGVPEERNRLSASQVFDAARYGLELDSKGRKTVTIGDEAVDGQTKMFVVRK